MVQNFINDKRENILLFNMKKTLRLSRPMHYISPTKSWLTKLDQTDDLVLYIML